MFAELFDLSGQVLPTFSASTIAGAIVCQKMKCLVDTPEMRFVRCQQNPAAKPWSNSTLKKNIYIKPSPGPIQHPLKESCFLFFQGNLWDLIREDSKKKHTNDFWHFSFEKLHGKLPFFFK